jgi:predicted RNA-binding Zn ribbon-like protein
MTGKTTHVSAATTRLVGGALCLDLANTVDWTHDGDERPAHTEALSTPADLAVWGARLGLAASGDLSVTGLELKATRRLRHAIHETFAAIAAGEDPPPQATEDLLSQYADAVAAGTLQFAAGRGQIAWASDDRRRIRFAGAVSAVELLSDAEQLARVHVCPGNNCGWLFLDATGRRRWCSMETCGSRAKMRRLYARRRAASRRDVTPEPTRRSCSELGASER